MAASDYQRIERAIEYLSAHYREQPNLKRVAAASGLSEFHFQRLFQRWAGVSPKRFVQYLTAAHARALLERSANVLDATDDVGLSSAGRLHDLMVTVHAATPGDIRRGGAGLAIRHGIHATPFGDFFVALTDKGVCALEFVASKGAALDLLHAQWPKAKFRRAPAETAAVAARLFRNAPRAAAPLSVYVKGTNFQLRVWEALLHIPPGALVTYEDVAHHIGDGRAVRAVANAVARNPVALLIPCHRVIRKSGALGGYRWGEARKQALLAWEAARYAVDDTAASMSARQRA
ncbi:MAG: methylated-DNA--[protein]-cysteine S-methyltransferase [Pseudomonadota bacterium]|nr:MAG: methylated-DNA--[protein]-cysteine S-methyltransferase [Pseudomonadota bacterium]